MFRRYAFQFLTIAAVAVGPAAARPDGNLSFHYVCVLGSKRASITTESGLLVYRFGTARRTELTIRQDAGAPNAFYRYDPLGMSGSSQQLRFASNGYSYGIASWFVARTAEGVGFFVMREGKLIRWQRCGGHGWFTEDNQLDRLPKDRMENVAVTYDWPR